ncbi:nickel pincer cofactor biosynthesis protein LarB [Dehalococcoidia bacterium]|nr:nickel pincer cofactor biosynthesis protein LarB [Dehalococcoidia bacterium]
MDKLFLSKILGSVAAGTHTPDQAVKEILNSSPIENHGLVNIDYDRHNRTGFPEVIFGQNKTANQISETAKNIFDKSGVVLVTRTNEKSYGLLLKNIPSAQYSPIAKCIWADNRNLKQTIKGLTVISAGTSDEPVAEEAIITASLMGCSVNKISDVGVAGLHRLTERLSYIRKARILIVVAGMEGALPSVVSGLVRAPVIAVPTSVGYGANFGGLTALLAMLNSCAAGVSVVNIDNGFGAGYQAASILGATN